MYSGLFTLLTAQYVSILSNNNKMFKCLTVTSSLWLFAWVQWCTPINRLCEQITWAKGKKKRRKTTKKVNLNLKLKYCIIAPRCVMCGMRCMHLLLYLDVFSLFIVARRIVLRVRRWIYNNLFSNKQHRRHIIYLFISGIMVSIDKRTCRWKPKWKDKP